MAELLIKLPNGTSVVIPKADPGNFKGLANEIPGNAGTDKVIVQNMAIARGLLIAADYGQRINNMTAAVNDDITTLKSLQGANTVLTSMTAASWNTTRVPGASTTINPVAAANSTFFASLGVDMSTAGAQKISLTIDGFTGTYSLPPPSTTTAGASAYEDQLVYLTDTKSYGMYTALVPGNNGSALDYPELFTASNVGTPYVETPTAAQLTGWQKQVSSQIESLSTVSQSKQAFLQNLIAELTKFFNFVTNLSERKERDLQGIADRI